MLFVFVFFFVCFFVLFCFFDLSFAFLFVLSFFFSFFFSFFLRGKREELVHQYMSSHSLHYVASTSEEQRLSPPPPPPPHSPTVKQSCLADKQIVNSCGRSNPTLTSKHYLSPLLHPTNIGFLPSRIPAPTDLGKTQVVPD